jgi:NAD(P)-dependent dehydrogenase (short-subunit alcohol dehydrogenase family)
MASYWVLGSIAAFIAIITFGIPMVAREYFPWQSLRAQHFGRPVPTTESYKGRTAMITGANGAFGSRAAKIFAHRDVETLILVDVRDCAGVKAEIEAELREMKKPLPNILVWQIDMMTYAGCQELRKKARALKSLDHALLTAGILAFNRQVSPEGWETCTSYGEPGVGTLDTDKVTTAIQVNFLSSALIGLLLLPFLKASPANPNPPVLTFVTTFAVYPSSFTMGVPRTGSYLKRMSQSRDGMEQTHQYGRSKGLLLYFARELAARVAANPALRGKVTVNSADPGSAWTPLTNPNQAYLIPRLIMNFGKRDPVICATALVNGVSSPAGAHGKIMQDFDTAS